MENNSYNQDNGGRKRQMSNLGSLLGQLCFIVYLNDLTTNSPYSKNFLYADNNAVRTDFKEADSGL